MLPCSILLALSLQGQDTLKAFQSREAAIEAIRNNQWDQGIDLYREASKDYLKVAQQTGDDAVLWGRAISVRRDLWKTYRDKGAFQLAFDSTLMTLEFAKQKLSPSHWLIGTLYQDLGIAQYSLNNYVSSIDFYEKAKTQWIKGLGPQNKHVARMHQNIGLTLLMLGRNEEAQKESEYAMEMYEALDMMDSRYVANTYMNLGLIQKNLGNMRGAIAYFLEAVETYKREGKKKTDKFGILYLNIGVSYSVLGDFDQALVYYAEALAIFHKVLDPNHPFFIGIYNNLGIVHYTRGDNHSAREYYEKAIAISETNKGSDKKALMAVYGNIGDILHEDGDKDQAFLYYQKSYDLGIKIFGEKHVELAIPLGNLGGLLRAKGDNVRAQEHFELTIDLLRENAGENSVELPAYYMSLGNVLRLQGKYGQALGYVKKILKQEKKIVERGSQNQVIYSTYLLLGKIHKDREEYDQAIKAFAKAEGYIQRHFGDRHPDLTISRNYLGEMYLAKGDHVKAQEYFRRAIFANVSASVANPGITPGYHLVFQPKFLIKSYRLYAASLQQSGEIKNLRKADTLFHYALDLVEEIRRKYLHEGSQLALQEAVFPVFEAAIKNVLDLADLSGDSTYLHRAFYLAERAKAVSLRQGIQENSARQFAGIPEELLEAERQLKIDLAYYEHQLYGLEAQGDSALKRTWREKVFASKVAFDSLQEIMVKNYPAYYELKYSSDIPTVDDIQAYLQERETALVEYVVGEEGLFVFLIQSESFHVWRQELPSDLLENILELRKQILNPDNMYFDPIQNQKDLIRVSYDLYQDLVKKARSHLQADIHTLAIVPDAYLGYLPFELLIEEPSGLQSMNFDKLPYLFRSFEISYGYSSTLLLQSSDAAPSDASGVAGFAPDYSSSILPQPGDSMASSNRISSVSLPLPGAKREVETIAKIWNGDAFIGQQASESTFKEIADSYQILHLSMHAILEDDHALYTHLSFGSSEDSLNDGSLHIAELYTLSLQAELAVLSACNTGFGELKRGEGIMSLSRAFAYAGVPSTVMTLWQIPDQSSEYLMERFHLYLKQGMSKEKALNQVRKDYLSQQLSPEKYHPFYWAGFVLNGNTDAIRSSSSSHMRRLLWIVLFLFLPPLIIIGLRFYRKGRFNH